MTSSILSFRCFAVLVVIFALSTLSFSQGGDTADIRGVVMDQTGAVVPGATVTATNNGTGFKRTTVSAADGQYALTLLPLGSYTVAATARGFQTLTNTDVVLTVGVVQRLDFRLKVGASTQEVTVQSAAPLVNTEEGRTSTLIEGARIENMPLNGRNIYDLMQLAAGAINTGGTDFEQGSNVSINGTRVNFTGYTIDGVENKQLSGGAVVQPPLEAVSEFRVETTNFSAEYGDSAGSITSLAMKSGTNQLHGSLFEFLRNDKLDSNNYFNKRSQAQNGEPNKPDPFKYNQFGAQLGGPIIKDKTFYSATYQGSTLRAGKTVLQNFESPQYVNLVSQVFNTAYGTQNAPTIGLWMMQNYKPPAGGTVFAPVATYTANGNTVTGYLGNVTVDPVTGVVSCDGSGLGGTCDYNTPLSYDPNASPRATALLNALANNQTMPMILSRAVFSPTRTRGNFNEGNEYTLRVDHNLSSSNRLFFSGFYGRVADPFFPGAPSGARGFVNPETFATHYYTLGWSSNITPTLINEARLGFTRSAQGIFPNLDGVPQVNIDDGNLGWGSYSGYPQTFIEDRLHAQDTLSWAKGAHNIKTGYQVSRNWENSEFNVGRSYYEFEDMVWFASDGIEEQDNGVNPDIVNQINTLNPTYKPIVSRNPVLSTNKRHWRNYDMAGFFNDDWKLTNRLTFNLGLRYDLYSRHTEAINLVTDFVFPPGNSLFNQLVQITDPLFGENGSPGGFRVSPNGHLGRGDHTNFAPRLGFAYDPRGLGRESIRAGFGMAYEGTFYNAESNSRWNMPFYSFNAAGTEVEGLTDLPVYGVRDSSGNLLQAPNPTGPNTNVGGAGDAPGFAGNIMGWNKANANKALLTGIMPPDARDPYVYSGFLGIQKQLASQSVLDVRWVVTSGHKLFRAENINRVPGDRCGRKGVNCVAGSVAVTEGIATAPATSGSGFIDPRGPDFQGIPTWPNNNPYNQVYSQTGNFAPGAPLFGTLRNWENVVNSIYNGLQVEFNKRLTHGLLFDANYTWSHNIDEGSTWHSGATTSNGHARGEGFTEDVLHPGLERGNSLLDNRHRFTASWVYELPWLKNQEGVLGHVLGGWQYNGDLSLQTGAPFTVWCNKSFPKCDWNGDGTRNDSPNDPGSNVPRQGNGPHSFIDNGGLFGPAGGQSAFPRPCFGCDGDAPRNGFRGPGIISSDMSFFKNLKLSERMSAQIRFEGFNVFNRINLEFPNQETLPGTNSMYDSQFGQSTALLTNIPMRQVQVGVRLVF